MVHNTVAQSFINIPLPPDRHHISDMAIGGRKMKPLVALTHVQAVVVVDHTLSPPESARKLKLCHLATMHTYHKQSILVFRWTCFPTAADKWLNVSLITIIIIIIIIIPRQCLWCCHHGRAIARVHVVHLMNVERPSGRRLNTKPDDLGCESACRGCQSLHPPSPFIITTQPES